MHEKVETYSKVAVQKELEQFGTSYAAPFSEDEQQQTMSGNPILVYRGIW